MRNLIFFFSLQVCLFSCYMKDYRKLVHLNNFAKSEQMKKTSEMFISFLSEHIIFAHVLIYKAFGAEKISGRARNMFLQFG